MIFFFWFPGHNSQNTRTNLTKKIGFGYLKNQTLWTKYILIFNFKTGMLRDRIEATAPSLNNMCQLRMHSLSASDRSQATRKFRWWHRFSLGVFRSYSFLLYEKWTSAWTQSEIMHSLATSTWRVANNWKMKDVSEVVGKKIFERKKFLRWWLHGSIRASFGSAFYFGFAHTSRYHDIPFKFKRWNFTVYIDLGSSLRKRD